MKWFILVLLCTSCTTLDLEKDGENFTASYTSVFRKLEDVHVQVGTATLDVGKAATDLDKSLEAVPAGVLK